MSYFPFTVKFTSLLKHKLQKLSVTPVKVNRWERHCMFILDLFNLISDSSVLETCYWLLSKDILIMFQLFLPIRWKSEEPKKTLDPTDLVYLKLKPFPFKAKGCNFAVTNHNTSSPLKTLVVFLQTLLDIFTGVKLYLPESVQDFEKLRRYFLAYDGDVVPEYVSSSATHTLGEPEDDCSAQRVTSTGSGNASERGGWFLPAEWGRETAGRTLP